MIDDISFDLHSIELEYDKIKLFKETIVNYYGLCIILINNPILRKYIECTGTEFIYERLGVESVDPQKNQYCFITDSKTQIPIYAYHKFSYKSNVFLRCILDYNTLTIEMIKNRHGNNWTKEINILEKKLNILFPESNECETK